MITSSNNQGEKMENYEGIFIVRPEVKDEDVKNIFKVISDSVTKNGGTVKKEEPWGKRPLAYPVKKAKIKMIPTMRLTCLGLRRCAREILYPSSSFLSSSLCGSAGLFHVLDMIS